ncbi:hypothetical protein PHYPSEUDO_002336 [Phytophthora pseudosyringae]|uniref:Uncharacterized protein n=1 Tax=Phytophthora pseudosyringae TaxID=221518 RepID=A0A8T1WDE4_9STRA|nr:hypothetical protein PHYPSEUDO_002336 [Phytophthora pseudosyringae]
MLSSAAAAAIPRAADTASKSVVQTADGQKIVRVCDARLAYGDIVGDEGLGGRLMSAGPILGLVDRFAGALAENPYHLEVEVDVFISHVRTKDHRKSHTRCFTVVNHDQLHGKTRISRGLLVDENDQPSMRTLLKAQHRYAFDKAEQKLLPLDRLDVSVTASRALPASTLRGCL